LFPAAFDYVRAHSVDEAIAGLQPHGPDARVLAGGQSLIPAMRFRLARPAVLVDINPIKELSYLREEGGFLKIGATTRDADLESSPILRRYPLLRDCSGVVADPVVRHMGTVVGSLCHNDPAGDWAAAALAANAQIVIRGAGGERVISIDDFIVDSYTTAVGDGEIALEVRIPSPGARTAGAYKKMERKVGDFATAAAAVRLTLDVQGICTAARVAITALGPVAMRVPRAEALLIGQRLTDEVIQAAAAEAPLIATPNADARGSAEYKKELGRILVARALHKTKRRLSAASQG
jgi:aerobic carbon-monoxide dehydrogenase medium subunit